MAQDMKPATIPERKTFREGLRMPFGDFWRLYLDAHRHPATRGCHYAATLLGAGSAVLGVLLLQPLVFAAAIIVSVAMAVSSHRFIEGNEPLIRVNPFYGAISDLRMCWLAVTGGLSGEYARLGLGDAAPLPNALSAG